MEGEWGALEETVQEDTDNLELLSTTASDARQQLQQLLVARADELEIALFGMREALAGRRQALEAEETAVRARGLDSVSRSEMDRVMRIGGGAPSTVSTSACTSDHAQHPPRPQYQVQAQAQVQTQERNAIVAFAPVAAATALEAPQPSVPPPPDMLDSQWAWSLQQQQLPPGSSQAGVLVDDSDAAADAVNNDVPDQEAVLRAKRNKLALCEAFMTSAGVMVDKLPGLVEQLTDNESDAARLLSMKRGLQAHVAYQVSLLCNISAILQQQDDEKEDMECSRKGSHRSSSGSTQLQSHRASEKAEKEQPLAHCSQRAEKEKEKEKEKEAFSLPVDFPVQLGRLGLFNDGDTPAWEYERRGPYSTTGIDTGTKTGAETETGTASGLAPPLVRARGGPSMFPESKEYAEMAHRNVRYAHFLLRHATAARTKVMARAANFHSRSEQMGGDDEQAQEQGQQQGRG
jgi:hypothetical protein